MKLTGILNQSLGGIYTFRGYASHDEIVGLSYRHDGYQRIEDSRHLEEIAEFILKGTNSFSPEIVLAYTLKYDYQKNGKAPEVNPLTDIISGVGFKSNVDQISVKAKASSSLEKGQLCTMTIPDKSYTPPNTRPFRRVDGNHRLMAIEKVMIDGQSLGLYVIPFCIIFFMDDDSLKSEKVIFHNINSKAVPIKSEELLKGILSTEQGILTFSDAELANDFGLEYALARKICHNRSLLISKLQGIEWIGEINVLSVLIDLILHVQLETKMPTMEEAFCEALSRTLDRRVRSGEGFKLPSGLLYLLTHLYYQSETQESPEIKKTILSLLAWSEKYDITALQVHDTKNCRANAKCIWDVFNQYIVSSSHTIFMSRCFASEYDENERAIQRAIDRVNSDKCVKIKLDRVDRHEEGVTGDIFTRIKRSITSCGLVIADLSSGRSNIPHEIGIAMGQHKDLLIIHRGSNEEAESHTPSNIKMFEQIRFDNNDYARLEIEIYNKLLAYYKL